MSDLALDVDWRLYFGKCLQVEEPQRPFAILLAHQQRTTDKRELRHHGEVAANHANLFSRRHLQQNDFAWLGAERQLITLGRECAGQLFRVTAILFAIQASAVENSVALQVSNFQVRIARIRGDRSGKSDEARRLVEGPNQLAKLLVHETVGVNQMIDIQEQG